MTPFFGTALTGRTVRGVRTELGFALAVARGLGLGSARFCIAAPGISSDTLVKFPFMSPTAHFKKVKAGDK
jgi:hypothetical protein